MTKARDLSKLLSTSNGKIAGSNLDVSFENISDTGTEGTKVASGTTAQRGSTTGQWRYNSTTGFFEGRGASSFLSLEPTPTVTSVDVSEVDTNAGGNQTFVITGTDFTSGGVIAFVANDASEFNADTTTFNSATQVTAVKTKSSFLNAKEPYKIKFTSASGKAGTSGSGLINVDSAPSWNTAAGSLGIIYHDITGNHFTLSATDAEGDAVTYSETGATNISGAGLALSNSGVISGNPTDVGSDTTVSFTGRATAGSKNTDRAFSFIVKPALGSSANPATSAKQLYDAGYTTDGAYYMNNTWTGGSARNCYCRFNTRNGVHWQRWTPDNLPNRAYGEHGGGASTTTLTGDGSADLSSKVLSTSKDDFLYESYSSGSGVSWIWNPRLQLSDLNGWYLGSELWQQSNGDGNNRFSMGFDYQSTDDGSGNWGHNYSQDLTILQTGHDTSHSNGVRNLGVIKFTANGSNTTYNRFNTNIGGEHGVGSSDDYDDLWAKYGNTSNAGYLPSNSGQYDYSGDIASSNYWTFRLAGWSDTGNTLQIRGLFWIGIDA